MKKNSVRKMIYSDSTKRIGIRVNKSFETVELVKSFCETVLLPQIIEEIEQFANPVRINALDYSMFADIINCGVRAHNDCAFLIGHKNSIPEANDLCISGEDIMIDKDLDDQLEYEMLHGTLTLVVIHVETHKVEIL